MKNWSFWGTAGLLLGGSLWGTSATAATYEWGDASLQVDTVLSVGASVRMEDVDEALIGIANGGTARSVNGDDGNYGFEKGDLIAGVAQGTVDLDFVSGRRWGAFSRISGFYNYQADQAGNISDRLAANDGLGRARARGEDELGDRGQERTEMEGELLDLFAWADVDVLGRPMLVRAGRQVVNWGEGTFIQNGLNVVNPIDVARFRLPGAELRNALRPISMLWASTALTSSLSIEAMWITEFQEIEIDPRGNYFSTNDFASDDGDKVVVSFGRRQDDNSRPFAVLTPDPTDDGAQQVWAPRESTRIPQDDGHEGGFVLRYFSTALNSTEFGLYYLNYHSRIPFASAIRGAGTTPGNLSAPLCSQDPAAEGCRASYFVEYPEDISLYGLSFNTNGPLGVAVQGEVSYRPNNPVQISGAEVVLAALVPAGSRLRPAGAAPGETITGFDRVATTQAQVTFTQIFGPSFGAVQWVVLGEVGYTHQDLSDVPFNGPGAALPSCAQPGGAALLAAVSNGSCQEQVGGGFATNSSWGYRLVSRLDYNNVFGSINVSPRAIFFHDVNGVSQNFNEDTMVAGLGVRFDYLQRWQADLSYTAYFGGRTFRGTDPVAPGTQLNETTFAPGSPDQAQSFATSANPFGDRDFVSLSVSYAF